MLDAGLALMSVIEMIVGGIEHWRDHDQSAIFHMLFSIWFILVIISRDISGRSQ